MATYFLAQIESVHDADMYAAYAMQVQPIVRQYGGEYIIRSDTVHTLPPDWKVERIILIRFENIRKLQQCFQSPEYLAVARLRENSTESRAIVIEE